MREWNHRVILNDIWKAQPFPQSAEKVIDRLRADWFLVSNADDDLDRILEELADAAEASDVEWFDIVWDAFYDWCDAEGVWVQTF